MADTLTLTNGEGTISSNPSWVKKLWRRNNESGTQDRFSHSHSFACFLLLFFNEDAGATGFADADTDGHTGRSAKSVCSATGAAAAGRHDRLGRKRSARATLARHVRRR